jgi:hypothetical protein
MNHTTGAQRYNKRKDDIFANAHRIESERLANGEKPNPNLTEKKKAVAKKMSSAENGRRRMNEQLAKLNSGSFLKKHNISDAQVKDALKQNGRSFLSSYRGTK